MVKRASSWPFGRGRGIINDPVFCGSEEWIPASAGMTPAGRMSVAESTDNVMPGIDLESSGKKMTRRLNNSGFTLVETLMAVVVFLGVVVPLMASVFAGRNQNRAQDLFTATCILEQETKKVQVLPDNPAPEIARTINGVEWKIKWDVTGDKIQTCVARVFKAGSFVADAGLLRTVQ